MGGALPAVGVFFSFFRQQIDFSPVFDVGWKPFPALDRFRLAGHRPVCVAASAAGPRPDTGSVLFLVLLTLRRSESVVFVRCSRPEILPDVSTSARILLVQRSTWTDLSPGDRTSLSVCLFFSSTGKSARRCCAGAFWASCSFLLSFLAAGFMAALTRFKAFYWPLLIFFLLLFFLVVEILFGA